MLGSSCSDSKKGREIKIPTLMVRQDGRVSNIEAKIDSQNYFSELENRSTVITNGQHLHGTAVNAKNNLSRSVPGRQPENIWTNAAGEDNYHGSRKLKLTNINIFGTSSFASLDSGAISNFLPKEFTYKL